MYTHTHTQRSCRNQLPNTEYGLNSLTINIKHHFPHGTNRLMKSKPNFPALPEGGRILLELRKGTPTGISTRIKMV